MGNQHHKPTNANDSPSSPSPNHTEPQPKAWFEFRAELKELWTHRDKDGNGKIDAHEMRLLVEDGVKTLGKGIANDTKKTAELVDDIVKDLDVNQDGKIGFDDFEMSVKKYLARTESNAINWFVDGFKDFEDEMRNSVKRFDDNLKTHIKEAIIEAAKSDSGLMDELIPIIIAKVKHHITADPDVIAALQCAKRDYEWMEQKFKAFDENVKPIEKKIHDNIQWFDDNKALIYGILGLAAFFPYMAVLKYLFF